MSLSNNDYCYYPSGLMMNSKQPMKNVDVVVLGTKNYIFFIPKKTVGLYFVLNTIKTHRLFEGVDIETGVKNIIENSNNVEELESAMIALLEEDDKYVHPISEKKAFKFRGFLGKHTLRMSTGGTNWASVLPNGKGNSKLFRTFYGQ